MADWLHGLLDNNFVSRNDMPPVTRSLLTWLLECSSQLLMLGEGQRPSTDNKGSVDKVHRCSYVLSFHRQRAGCSCVLADLNPIAGDKVVVDAV